jgi:hypothetical protein
MPALDRRVVGVGEDDLGSLSTDGNLAGSVVMIHLSLT